MRPLDIGDWPPVRELFHKLEMYIIWCKAKGENFDEILTGLASFGSMSESDWSAIDLEEGNLKSRSIETLEDMLQVIEEFWSFYEESCEFVLISELLRCLSSPSIFGLLIGETDCWEFCDLGSSGISWLDKLIKIIKCQSFAMFVFLS